MTPPNQSQLEIKGGIDAAEGRYNPPAPESWAEVYHEGWGALDYPDKDGTEHAD